MKKIILSADTTCDLPKDLIEKYNIQIIPLYIHLDDKEYRDSIDINPDFIYNYYEENKILPTTSAPNIADYLTHFKKWDPTKYDIIHITLGSGISSTYQNAFVASEEFENVYVIDSKSLSAASSLLILEAVDMINDKKTTDEIVNKLKNLRENIEVSFVLDSLTYLREGGRLNALQAFGSNLLNIKPCIEVKHEKNGQMEVGNKYRGKLSKVIKKYLSDRLENRDDIDTKRIFILNSGTSEEIIETTINGVKEYQNFDEMIVSRAGCTISSHCGYNSVGVIFINK